MGYLRFFLAFLVLLSHVDVRFMGLNPGVFAVVIFYMLAGSVVSHLWIDVIPHKKYKVFYFYKERLLRIVPLYMYVAFLTVLFILFTGYGNPHFTFYNIFANLTIIPLNFYMFRDPAILTQPSWWLIPPAWSLGTELQAYILLPFLLQNKKLFWSVFIGSFSIYLLANLQVFHPDYFGYRLIVGVIFIFLIGSMLNNKNNTKKLSVLWMFLLFIYGYFYVTKSFHPTYTHETILGLLVGLPMAFFIKKSTLKLPLDSFMGKLSYGLFLSHFLVIWVYEKIGIFNTHDLGYSVKVTLLATFIALVGVVFIEAKVQRYRLALTKSKKN